MAISTISTIDGSEELPSFTTPLNNEQRWFFPFTALLSARRRWFLSSPQFYATLLCFVLVVTVDMAAYLSSAPQIRLFESIICLDYYKENDPGFIDGNGNVPEEHCKIDQVQGEIAMLNGFQTLFSNIPGTGKLRNEIKSMYADWRK